MDWPDLMFFAAAAEELSFSRAAARLNVTHPAVSQRIARLERRLRVRLFERSSQGVRLTDAGHELLPRAQELLALRRDAERAIRLTVPGRADPATAAALTFGTVEIRSHRLVPFVERTTGRRLSWVTDTTPILVEKVTSGALAAALCAQFPGESMTVPPGCSVMTVGHDPIWIMMSAAAAAERTGVTLDELRDLTWIVSPPSQHPHDWETAVVTGLGARWVATMQHPGEQLVATGEAVAFGSALVRDNDRTGMVPLVPAMARHLFLLWGPDLPPADAARLGTVLLDYYRSQAQLTPQLRTVTRDHTTGNEIDVGERLGGSQDGSIDSADRRREEPSSGASRARSRAPGR